MHEKLLAVEVTSVLKGILENYIQGFEGEIISAPGSGNDTEI